MFKGTLLKGDSKHLGKLKHKNEIESVNSSVKNISESDIEAENLSKKIIELALDQKSLDTVGFNVCNVSNIAKYIIIASGTSSRHVKGIADKIESGLTTIGVTPLRTDGYDLGEWIVMDFEDVIVHLFYEPKRQYYELDALLNGAEKLVLSDDLTKQIRQLKTGLHAL